MKVSDSTAISMPMRNLLSILAATALGVWAYFGIIERLNTLETDNTLMKSDLTKAVEFSIKWPRGELGSLPADSEQFLLIESLLTDVEDIQDIDGITNHQNIIWEEKGKNESIR